jgi:ketosteroid isomerase-like protein
MDHHADRSATEDDRLGDSIVDAYFAAMRRGSEAEADMMALFTDDAVYDEPFSGELQPAVGADAIRDRFRYGWKQPMPGLELDVLSVDVAGSTAISRWECRADVFPAPVRGTDHYEFREGRISSLRVTLDEAPPA